MKTYTKLSTCSMCDMGCDPEIFIEKGGKVVGAEKLLPTKGLASNGGRVIIDGVQAELNPAPSHCRALMGNNIKSCLEALRTTIQAKGYNLSKSGTVEVPQKELESLAKENQRLGCGPSFNAYNSKAKVVVDEANKYRRSAGGHIHMACFPEPEVIIPVLDLVVGNTCVLIDRDPDQALRRQQYGRAGEYRKPPHGFEYRTPSNFWLRSFQLMGFVMQLCRMSHRIAGGAMKHGAYMYTYDGKPWMEALEWLSQNVDTDQVQEAINKNDFELAQKNWQVLKEFVTLFIADVYAPQAQPNIFPLWPSMLPAFDFFVKKGIDHWWPEKDICKEWDKLGDQYNAHGDNWEGWFHKTVIPQFNKQPRAI